MASAFIGTVVSAGADTFAFPLLFHQQVFLHSPSANVYAAKPVLCLNTFNELVIIINIFIF